MTTNPTPPDENAAATDAQKSVTAPAPIILPPALETSEDMFDDDEEGACCGGCHHKPR